MKKRRAFIFLHGRVLNETTLKWFCILLSSVGYSLPFLMPSYCAELVWCAWAPLFFLTCRNQCSWPEGFVWGLINSSMYYYGMGILINDYAQGPYKFVLFGIFIMYVGALSALWFSLVSVLHRVTGIASGSWLLATFCYLLYIDYAQYICFGVFEGNKLYMPLLPLAARTAWIYGVHYIGVWAMIFCVLIINMGIGGVCALKKIPRCGYYLCIIGGFLPFIMGWFIPQEDKEPFYKQYLCRCSKVSTFFSPWHHAQQLGACINYIVQEEKYSSFSADQLIIIAPEATFDFPLNYYQEVLACFHKPCVLYIGAQRLDNEQYYNCIYKCQNGRIIECYDKKHPLFLTECIPPLLKNIECIADLFLRNKNSYASGADKQMLSCWIGLMEPVACSELFFNKYEYQQKEPLLALVNDGWFRAAYIPKLLFLYARFTACITKREIIYVSYNYGAVIDKNGISHALAHYTY